MCILNTNNKNKNSPKINKIIILNNNKVQMKIKRKRLIVNTNIK